METDARRALICARLTPLYEAIFATEYTANNLACLRVRT